LPTDEPVSNHENEDEPLFGFWPAPLPVYVQDNDPLP
jgi:hypothetical protein